MEPWVNGKQGLKPALPWWFDFDPYPVSCQHALGESGLLSLSEPKGRTKVEVFVLQKWHGSTSRAPSEHPNPH